MLDSVGTVDLHRHLGEKGDEHGMLSAAACCAISRQASWLTWVRFLAIDMEMVVALICLHAKRRAKGRTIQLEMACPWSR
jgi:hypothetical protein